MKWTKKLPKKEGTYWFKDYFTDPVLVDIIEINNKLFILNGDDRTPVEDIVVFSGYPHYWSNTPIPFPKGGDE